MTVDVYVWLPKGQEIGHAALLVNGSTPGSTVYLSQWPGEFSAIYWPGKGASNTPKDDIEIEKRQPHVVRLWKLNEVAVRTEIYKKKKSNHYWFLYSNCASQVRDCLDAGIPYSSVARYGVYTFEGVGIGYQAANTPWGVYIYAKIIKRLTE